MDKRTFEDNEDRMRQIEMSLNLFDRAQMYSLFGASSSESRSSVNADSEDALLAAVASEQTRNVVLSLQNEPQELILPLAVLER